MACRLKKRTDMTLRGFACAIAILMAAAPAFAQPLEQPMATAPQPRSRAIAYTLAVGGTLAPIYLAGALNGKTGQRTQVALIGGGICWGPSLGFAYARAWPTAILSGLGKSALLSAALWLDERSAPGEPEADHAGATLLATVAVAAWTALDLFRLAVVVESENAKARRGLALGPYLSVGGKASAVGLTGRF